MKNSSYRKVTLYYGDDIIFTSLVSSGLVMDFPFPVTITRLKIEEVENPQDPDYRREHLSESSVG